MHEVGIAADIFAIAEQARPEGRVTRVTVEIGRLNAVLADALVFAWDLLREGTDLDGAELCVIEIPAKAVCGACGAVTEMDRPFGLCPCGSDRLDWLAGDELRVKNLEVG